MATQSELLEQRKKVQDAINNVMTAGQEFQTRTTRVKQASLSELRKQLADIDNELSYYKSDGYTDTVLMKFGGSC